jgi:hypothetical protein
MPNEVGLDILAFMLLKDALLDPSDAFPALELYDDLTGVDGFEKVEVDVSLDGVSSEIKRLVDLDECA